MPMKMDPQGGGTNADGSKNEKYCSHCYQKGKFVGGEVTVKEFQEFCRKMMIESGHSKFMAWLCTRGMNRLERWKKK